MKLRTFFMTLLLLLAALVFTLPEDADAARFGGGRSFGGKPFMSTPAPAPSPGMARPAAPTNRPGQVQGQPQAGSRGMFGGMGGLMGGLLAGTLIGSLLSGHGFAGGGFMDILIFGLLIYLGFKLFARMRSRTADATAGDGHASSTSAYQYTDTSSSQEARNASAGWDMLRDADNSGAINNSGAVSVPQGFDTEEFLRGAKMVYSRLQNAWDKRDMEDIAEFATPAVMETIREQMEADPTPSTTEVLLVNANLLHVEEDGDDQHARVYFDVLLREDQSQQTPSSVREIWHFTRPQAGGNWKLNGIQQVERG